MTPEDPPADAVAELLKLLEAEFPDPVDVFEDELASQLGVERHPACPLEEWRRLRVPLIDGAEDEGILSVQP